MTDFFFDYDMAGPATRTDAFLAACTEAEWAMILDHSERVRVPKGATVVAAGSLDRCLSIVLDGTLETVQADWRGHWRRQMLHPVGSVIGELEFLDGHASDGLVRAVRDAELLELPLASFDVLAAKNPQLGMYVLAEVGRALAVRLRAAVGPGRTS